MFKKELNGTEDEITVYFSFDDSDRFSIIEPEYNDIFIKATKDYYSHYIKVHSFLPLNTLLEYFGYPMDVKYMPYGFVSTPDIKLDNKNGRVYVCKAKKLYKEG